MSYLRWILPLLLTLAGAPLQAAAIDCSAEARLLTLQLRTGYTDGLRGRVVEQLARCPADQRLHRVYQRVALEVDQEGDRVLAEYRHLLAQHPGDPTFTELLAHVLVLGFPVEERHEEARTLLNALDQSGRATVSGLVQLSAIASNRKQTDTALALAERAYALDPALAAEWYITTLTLSQKVSEAITTCERWLRGRAPTPSACAGIWRPANLKEEQSAARQELEATICALMPRRPAPRDSVLLWELLAFSNAARKRSPGGCAESLEAPIVEALSKLHPDLKRVVKSSVARTEVFERLRTINQEVDMPRRVAALRALSDELEGEQRLWALGALYQAYQHPLVKDEAASLAVVVELLEADPTNWSVLVQGGEALLKAGELDRLERILEEGMKALPSDVNAGAMEGDPGHEMLVTAWSTLADLHHLRGRLHHARGRYDDAVRDLLTAWHVQFVGFEGAEGYRSEIAFHLGEVYDASGRPREAFEAYLLAASGEGEFAASARELLIPRLKDRYPGWSDVDSFIAEIGKAQRPDEGAPPVTDAAAKEIAESPHPLTNQPLPAVALTDLEGNALKLEDFKGKVIYLTFWATWCAPCMAEMPIVASLKATWGDSVEVVAVAMGDELSKVKVYAEQTRLPFHFAMAPPDAGSIFTIAGIPFSCVVDAGGTIREVHAGYSDDLLTTLPRAVEAARAP